MICRPQPIVVTALNNLSKVSRFDGAEVIQMVQNTPKVKEEGGEHQLCLKPGTQTDIDIMKRCNGDHRASAPGTVSRTQISWLTEGQLNTRKKYEQGVAGKGGRHRMRCAAAYSDFRRWRSTASVVRNRRPAMFSVFLGGHGVSHDTVLP